MPEEKPQEHEIPERPEQAVESGEPGETGRSRGRIIDKEGQSASGPAAEESVNKPDNGSGPHWESGRHQARE